MGQNRNGGNAVIRADEVTYARVPYFINIEPLLAVAAGVTSVVQFSVGVKDFIWTDLGFTSAPVGLPAAGQPFKLGMQDIGKSRDFQPAVRWHLTAAIGTNPGVADATPLKLPVPWKFSAKTTISVTFENIGTLACLPTLVLIGFLDQIPSER